MDLDLADINALLRHPLFLVVATGLVSSYLIPRLTRRWQDHQKAIEIRTNLATEVTEAVVRFVLAVQLAERRTIDNKAYDSAYQEWEVRRATLESEIRGQFQDGSLATEWASLSEAVTALYRLSGTYSEPYRSQVLEELKAFFSLEPTDWQYLEDYQKKHISNDDFQRYFGAWWKLREATLMKSGDLTRRILSSRTTSFD